MTIYLFVLGVCLSPVDFHSPLFLLVMFFMLRFSHRAASHVIEEDKDRGDACSNPMLGLLLQLLLPLLVEFSLILIHINSEERCCCLE